MLTTIKGKCGIEVGVVADSLSPENKRITTIEITCHRWVLAELSKHRTMSMNFQSSRAVPVQDVIASVRENPAVPVHWGKKQSGMQADNEVTGTQLENLKEDWDLLATIVSKSASYMDTEYEAHKQIVNRLLEPYTMIKGVITATEWDNFFHLRCHKDAQPEIKELADCIYKAMQESVPTILDIGDWHVPYYNELGVLRKDSGEDLGWAKKVSAAGIAQVSFRKLDLSEDKVNKVWGMLVDTGDGNPIHAVPTEHQATPMKQPESYLLDTKDSEGITHIDTNWRVWSGNFKGWIQHRQLIPKNVCNEYEDTK